MEVLTTCRHSYGNNVSCLICLVGQRRLTRMNSWLVKEDKQNEVGIQRSGSVRTRSGVNHPVEAG